MKDVKQYRTEGQWDEMVENMINGNWTDAAQNAVDYGWWSNDIQNVIDNGDWMMPDELSDFMYVVEKAQELRHK